MADDDGLPDTPDPPDTPDAVDHDAANPAPHPAPATPGFESPTGPGSVRLVWAPAAQVGRFLVQFSYSGPACVRAGRSERAWHCSSLRHRPSYSITLNS